MTLPMCFRLPGGGGPVAAAAIRCVCQLGGLGVLIATALATSAVTRAAEAAKPNFLIILTDDHGYGDVSLYHPQPTTARGTDPAAFEGGDVRTPNIDRIGREGLRFTAMRSNCTVCSPSRAALLTGMFPDRVGVPGVIRTASADSWGYLDPAATTLADELKRLGYHTGIVGKWHLGLESPNTPNERGFDHFHGFLGDMMDSYTNHLRHGRNYLRFNREPIAAQGHATDLFTEWAAAYLRERAAAKDRPFFLYLAYNAPHFPIEPPAEWLERVHRRAPNLPAKRAANVAFVEHLDERVGQVLRTLDETGLARNTVVVFSADNGGSVPHAQSNRPWRGGKQDHYDGGLRVPFLIRWPAGIASGRASDYAGQTFDLFPTFVELAGGAIGPRVDAISLAPIIAGGTIDRPRDLYFTRREGGAKYAGKSYEAIVRGPWKLLQNDPFQPFELYHLGDDPGESRNVAADHPKIVRELEAALRGHIQRGGAVPWQPPAMRAAGPPP
jgi:arylsulfatase A-like enzyme